MTLRQYLCIMALATALCWTAWILVLFRVDPFEVNILGFAFFYTSLFLALLGTSSLIAFMLYHFFSRHDMPMFRVVEKSFRDGLSLSVIGVAILVLQSQGWLTLWTTGFTLIGFLTIVLIVIAVRRPRSL